MYQSTQTPQIPEFVVVHRVHAISAAYYNRETGRPDHRNPTQPDIKVPITEEPILTIFADSSENGRVGALGVGDGVVRLSSNSVRLSCAGGAVANVCGPARAGTANALAYVTTNMFGFWAKHSYQL